ncbi:MAG: dTMP kinase [Thermoprotei archaeon]
MLIVFEGIDGSGKTTQAKILTKRLTERGLKVFYSKEPTEGIIGRFIREEVLSKGRITDPRSIALLYAADRSIHLNSVIFSDDVINIFDRFYYSSIAYQGALGVPVDYIMAVNSFAPKPDLTFLMDIDPLLGLKRLNRFDRFENVETLVKVREIYLSLAKQYGMIVVDAAKGEQEISDKIIKILEETRPVVKTR